MQALPLHRPCSVIPSRLIVCLSPVWERYDCYVQYGVPPLAHRSTTTVAPGTSINLHNSNMHEMAGVCSLSCQLRNLAGEGPSTPMRNILLDQMELYHVANRSNSVSHVHRHYTLKFSFRLSAGASAKRDTWFGWQHH